MLIIYFARQLACRHIRPLTWLFVLTLTLQLAPPLANSNLSLGGEVLDNRNASSRLPTERSEDARLRHLRNQPISHFGPNDSASVYESQTSFAAIKLNQISELANLRTIQEIFQRLRDTRSWRWNRMPNFPRRLMWVYPSDGCYLRTAMMDEKLAEWGAPPPKNLFIFGELSFSNKFQQMTWWYHVAPVYRLGNQVYVLDPALNPSAPLKLQDWILSMTKSMTDSTYALCEAGAFNPYDECSLAQSTWDIGDRTSTLQDYLGREWEGLEEILGTSPSGILGEHPPWQFGVISK